MERVPEKQKTHDALTHPGWEDAANDFHAKDEKSSTSQFNVAAVIKPPTDDEDAAPPPTTFGHHIQSLNIIPGILQMPHGPSQPVRSHIRLRSGKP
jgi:hypothetical protein